MLTFKFGFDINDETREIYYDDQYDFLPTPQRAGYEFKGWFDELNEEVLETDIYKLNQNQNLYAEWELVTYNAIFYSNGGNVVPSIDFTIHTDDIELSEPQRTGYSFKGWYDNSLFMGLETYKIKTGTFENQTYYAKWEPQIFKLVLKFNDGSSGDLLRDISYDASYGVLPNPDRIGYEFSGWFDKK